MNELQTDKKAWVISADMGYGHQRAVYPLQSIAEGGILTVGDNDSTPDSEKKLWSRVLGAYELLSRARSIPLIGKALFNILDTFMHIPSFYPMRNLSSITFQVNLLDRSIKNGLCGGILEKVKSKHLPFITSFYAPAIAADLNGLDKIYSIICDADMNRVWVAKDPWDSRIEYFAPCGKAAQRLRAYGVPDERIHLTGFPLSVELLGGKDLHLLKSDLAQRLFYLDPHKRFWERHSKNVEHFLGEENCVFKKERKLTITFAVGGAGAQKEIGRKIAISLKEKILKGDVHLILIAGTKEMVNDYFLQLQKEHFAGCENLTIMHTTNQQEYFKKFNDLMRVTDILWTKPSELSFYTGLGIPIVMAPAIGSQELFNKRWLLEVQAGFKQLNPEYADQWLFDMINKGRLADAAWSGFLKVRKLGTYKILEVLETGKMVRESSPVLR
ncbi:MAG: hypothetical protein IPM56_15115 [Ignavibacteriales bacterium]|nr:MAG: hypothetical protein IPM56_15115 [Ignavibacteriales bacterium]